MTFNLAHNTYSIKTKGSVIILVKYNGVSRFTDLSAELSTLVLPHTNVKTLHIYIDCGTYASLKNRKIKEFLDSIFISCDVMKNQIALADSKRKLKIFIHYSAMQYEAESNKEVISEFNKYSEKWKIPTMYFDKVDSTYSLGPDNYFTILSVEDDHDIKIGIARSFKGDIYADNRALRNVLVPTYSRLDSIPCMIL